ncbi:hypothetical protein JXA32_11115 [Candidatus Sumerlaeota bacterium]|nr:hypothetical protein [Candidatus Sumerlaeota bacterium]
MDAVNGDDANNGLTTDTAKQTIQAAVDLLPARIPANVTVVVLPGTYPEQVNLDGISVAPDKSLHIVGDTTWSPASPGDPNVIITGADAVAPTTPVRNDGMLIANCAYVDVTGLMFQIWG